jgi:competence protein ComEC
MTKVRIIVFDVQQGFCAFLKSPTNHTLLIDCGRGDEFSPAIYVANNELEDSIGYGGKKLTWMTITHPHDDHIEDISKIEAFCPPGIISRQVYNWKEVKDGDGDYENLDEYEKFQSTYYQPVLCFPDFGLKVEQFALTPADAKKLNETKFVNNSSIVTIVAYQGSQYSVKFLFGGDIEEDGWQQLLKREDFKSAVKGVDVYVTSHHGHTSGFSKDLFDLMGTPIVNIVSAHRKDGSVDARYSTEAYARGFSRGEETRRMLSTRNDGSIFFDVSETGKVTVSTSRLAPNDVVRTVA